MFELMKVLYDCGAITNDEIEVLDIDFSIVDDLLKKEQIYTKMENNKVFYYLNDFGEKMYRLEKKKKTFFRCANLKKMKSLVDFYCKLSKEERETWKSKDEWYFEGNVGPIPDATYIKNGELFAVYVQTDITSKNMIDKIEQFVKNNDIKNINYLKS